GEDVGAPEHAPEVVVDLDVGVTLPPLVFMPEEADRARPRVEVEELGGDLHVRRLPGEEDRHHGDDDRHRQSVAQQEMQVGFDPALRDHSGPPPWPSRLRSAPSIRNTSPSAPTASPAPPGSSAIERIQRAASWIGSGSVCQVAPPSALRSTVPASPTIQPRCPATATS